MHIYKATGDPNIGLYCFTTNNYCLVGKEVSDKHVENIQKVLKVPVHKITIAGTSLLGVFVTGNDNCLLLPEITYPEELVVLDKLGIKYEVIETSLTALGNNMLCNEKGALLSKEFSVSAKTKIEKALKVKSKFITIANFDTLGSLGSFNTFGGIFHFDVTESEVKIIESVLGIKVYKGTVNLGNPYIRSGLLCNDNGFVVGGLTMGPELNDIDENLGFLG